MKKSFSIVGAVMIVLAVGMIGLASAQDDDVPMADLRFVVVRDYNGKPVRNAAVVLHPVTKKGKQSRGGRELKTDGEDYEINKAEMEITVKLKRPGGQYSVYENHGDDKKADNKKPTGQKPQ